MSMPPRVDEDDVILQIQTDKLVMANNRHSKGGQAE